MKINIVNLPNDIIKQVTYKNWKKSYWKDVIYEDDYVWAPSVMYKFINSIVKSMKPKLETSRQWNKRVMSKANLKKFAKLANEEIKQLKEIEKRVRKK